MGKKYNKKASETDIFRILDNICLLQECKRENKTLYVPKRAYKEAKSILKAQKKYDEIKIKTY